MADPQKLDLDALLPEPAEVKIGGVTYNLMPVKMSDLVFLSKILVTVDKADNDQAISNALEAFKNYLPKFIEGFDPVKNDITLQQAFALIQFIFDVSAPPEAKKMSELGIKPAVNQKKISDTVS